MSEQTFQRAMVAVTLLEEHLDEENDDVNFSNDEIEVMKLYIKDESTINLFFFAKYVLGFDLMTIETHKVWADNLMKAFFKTDRLMRLKPRATYKSTLYGVSFMLWLWACIDPGLRIFYTSANSLLLEEVSDKISSSLNPEDKSVFQLVFGIIRDVEGSSPPKNTGEIFNIVGRTGKGFSLILRTAGGSTVGIHPNIIIVDDPMDKNDRESITVRNKKEHWFDTLTPLLVPFVLPNGNLVQSLMFIATRWHREDLCHYVMKMNEKTKEWDIESESIYDSHGNTNYPEFITDEAILKIKGSINQIFFACQYMNDPLPEGLRVFNINLLKFDDPGDIDITRGKNMCFFDPAKGAEDGDWAAPVWTNFYDNALVVIDSIREKTEIIPLLSYIAQQNKRLGVRHMIYEDNGSGLLQKNLTEAHKRIKHPIFIEPISQSRGNKEERIVNMQPDLYSGFCGFMSDYETRYPELIDQLCEFPTHRHDDFPDVLEMAIDFHAATNTFTFQRYARMS